VVDILGGIAVLLLIAAGGVAMRRAGSAARYPGRARSRANPAGYARRPARTRKSWLVTAAKAAGVKVSSDHLGGASAELAGAATGRSLRAGARLARAGGQVLERAAARRWQARGATVRDPLMVIRAKNTSTDTGTDPAAGPAAPAAEPAAAADPAPAPAGTGPITAPPGARPAPARGRKEIRTMRQRYSINLEPPATDAEFLESCVQLGDVLKALAGEVSNWADGLSGLHLPTSVLSPLHSLCEGIEEAATGATSAAKAFEDEFEDARDVAARGMHFTGQDAA
jgi:hypothetical protein